MCQDELVNELRRRGWEVKLMQCAVGDYAERHVDCLVPPDRGTLTDGAEPLLLWCPSGHRHVDKGEYSTKPHHTHACQECGIVWRPAIGPTVGVQFLPGFKSKDDHD